MSEENEYIEKIKAAYEIGQSIFIQLFSMSDLELKNKLVNMPGIGSMAGGIPGLGNNSLIIEGSVTRTIIDEKPSSIEFHYYDSLKLDYSGIKFKPEHGSGEYLARFTENFKL